MCEEMENEAKESGSTATDIISDLPRDVTETILVRLPIRDAVRTSILSTKWKYKWTYLPKLAVNNDSLLPNQQNQNQNQNPSREILYRIFTILLQKNVPTLVFRLDITSVDSCSGDLDILLSKLSKNGMEKLTLCFSYGGYKLPRSVFSCSHLTHLHLQHCAFELPMEFTGFSCLIFIHFEHVSFDAKSFGNFLLSCPVLEALCFIQCTSFSFEVSAPKLRFIHLDGGIDAICLKDAPLLEAVSLYPKSAMKIPKKGSMIEFFDSLPVLEEFRTSFELVKFLVAGHRIPYQLPISLVGLRDLELCAVSFGMLDEVLFTLCLIRSSPNLKNLTIEFSTGVTALGIEAVISEKWSDLSLNQLKKVVFLDLSGTVAEMEFMKILLWKTPVLESVHLEPVIKDPCEKFEFLKR